MLEKIVEKVKNNVPLPAFIIFVCTAVSAVLHIAFVKVPAFADFFNRYRSSVFRKMCIRDSQKTSGLIDKAAIDIRTCNGARSHKLRNRLYG